ncbi:MAG: hypothetical protein EZS28_038137, partial [Streblomastix strix]
GNEAGDFSMDDEDYITRGYVEGNYVTNNSAAAQQILGVKTFTGNVNAPAFVKSSRTSLQVLLANGSTEPISEFTGTPTDLSNYYNKRETYSRTETDNKYTFNANVNATGFVKTGKDDTSVLLAGGGDMLISAFGGLELVNITYTNDVVNPTSIMSLKSYRYGSPINFYSYVYMDNGAGTSGASVAVCIFANAGFPKYQFQTNHIVFAGFAPHTASFKFETDGKVSITTKALTGTAGLAGAASAYINVTYPAAN